MKDMIILAADTSTPRGSVALKVQGGEVLERLLPEGVPHSETLLPAILELLESCGLNLKDLTALAIGIGPGAFTGLRVGLSTFKGLAFDSGLPLAPVPSLDAVAFPLLLAGKKAVVAADARKGEIYAACYSGIDESGLPERDCDVVLVTPDEFPVFYDGCPYGDRELVGNGAAMIKGVVDFIPSLVSAGDENEDPRASFILELGRRMFEGGKTVAPSGLVPFYVRPPDATPYRDAPPASSGRSRGKRRR